MPLIFRKWLKKIGIQDPFAIYPKLILLYALVHTVQMLVFMFVEGQGFWLAFYMTLQTNTTIGYGDHPPQTIFGQQSIMILSFAGVGLLGGAFISGLAEFVESKAFKRRHGLIKKNPNKNGAVIVYLPGEYEFKLYVEEVRSVEGDFPICIIDHRFDELPSWVRTICPDVVFIKGSVTDPETYIRANLEENYQVIIFPKDFRDSTSDLISDTIAKLALEHSNGKTAVMVDVVDPGNLHLFNAESNPRLSCTLVGAEILSLAQNTHGGFTIEWFMRLMSNREGANPKTVSPKEIVGWTWGNLVQYSIFHGEDTDSELVNPLALIKPGKSPHPITNPRPNERIEKGDYIIIAAYNSFIGWEKYEAILVGDMSQ